jgi:hypothetical protein
MTLDCAPAIKALWTAWWLLPLIAVGVVWFLTRGASGPVLQESRISFHYMAAIGGSWMLLGLALAPFLGAHGSALAKQLLLAAGWSATAGAWFGPTIVEWRYRPPSSAAGELVEFLPTGRAGHMVQLSPTSGDAASAGFLVPQEWWNATYARAGNKAIKGKVYKGGRNLWFARFD